MTIYLRPSKTFFFNFLKKQVQVIQHGVGIDAACAGMKNRHMFNTEFYYGVDINPDLLKAGLSKYPDRSTYGILADMAKLDPIPDNCADLIVSSNTLYTIPVTQQLNAISHLCRITTPTGKLILELPISSDTDDIQKRIRTVFKNVETTFYKNPISNIYEKIFEKKGDLGSHPMAGSKPFLALSWLISLSESLTRYFKFLNKNAVFVCTNKHSGIKNTFKLNSETLHDRIYFLN